MSRGNRSAGALGEALAGALGLALSLATPAAAAAETAPKAPANRSTAAEPDYRDDRSDAEAVIRSLYNAISRREYVRAYSYFRDEPGRPSFADFAAGYRTTASVEVRFGRTASDGAAGSLYSTVPVAIRSTASDGARRVFTGCYELRIVQPGIQAEPPFHPLGIVTGKLAPTTDAFNEATLRCPAGGRP